MKLGVLISVFIYEIIVIFGAGLILSRMNKNKAEADGSFALAGRGMGVITLASTVALTGLGTAHILGIFEMSYFMGAVAVWFSLAHVVVILVCCFATGLWVRRLGITTIPEALKEMYGKGVSTAIACVMAGMIWGILTLETQGVGVVVATMTGWSITQAAVIGGILGIFYVVMAGMKEIGVVNVINAVILYLGIILATIFVALKLPGGNFDSVQAFYTADSSTNFMLSIFGTPDLMITFALGNVIAVVFCHGISQVFLQAFMSAKDEKTIRRSAWIAAPLNGLFGVFAVVLGLTARAIPEFAELGPKMAATTMLVEYIPNWVATVLLASLLAAILSTFAMTSFTPATIFAIDIYKGMFKKDASEREVKQVIRISVIILALIAMAVAAYLPPIIGAINWLFAWIVPVFWLFIFGLFWKRNSKVAAVTLIITWALNCVWSFTALPAAIGGTIGALPNGYVTLIVSVVVLVIGNLTTKGEPSYFKTKSFQKV